MSNKFPRNTPIERARLYAIGKNLDAWGITDPIERMIAAKPLDEVLKVVLGMQAQEKPSQPKPDGRYCSVRRNENDEDEIPTKPEFVPVKGVKINY